MNLSGTSLMSNNHQNCLNLALGLGFCRSYKIVRISSIVTKRRRFCAVNCTISSNQRLRQQQHQRALSEGGLDHENYEGFSSLAGGIVALGKFDALHVGHRELAVQASKIGTPYLLSFSRMAEVLGWEPRPPIVAKSDRRRVLSSWAPYCGNVVPKEFQVQFSSVRHLTPRQFVEKLSKELGVHGVVAGENYRFGYKAAGNATELVRLCEEFGIGAYIINSVMDKKLNMENTEFDNLKEQGQVSSTRVRQALALGDMEYVSELLGRQHRLVLMVKDQDSFLNGNHNTVSFPRTCLLNLPPGEGFYKNCSVFIGNERIGSFGVLIDTTHIHLEMEVGSCICDSSQELQLLGIEFGNLES